MRLRTLLIGLAVIVLLPLAGGAIFLATFDANAYRPQVIEAVRNATGRELRMTGAIRLKPALRPALAIDDVGFANMPGGSRPEMATLARLEVEIALLPLLSRRVEVVRLVLVQPDILLERLADGRANWQLAPPAAAAPPASAAAPTAPAQPTARAAPPAIGVDSLVIREGKVALRDAVSGQDLTLALSSLEASVPAGDRPMALSAEAVLNGQQVALRLAAGALSRLLDPAATTPWPVDLTASAAGARATAKGSIARPMEGRGYHLAIAAEVADATRLAAFAPDVPIPPLRAVRLAVQVADRGGALPELRALSLAVGESDLNALHPGLRLARLELGAAAADQPLRLVLQAAVAAVPIAAEGTLGPLAAFLAGAAEAPWPIRLAASAGAARLSVDGALARPAEGAGLAARIEATVPELAALSPLAGQALPALRDVRFQANLAEHARGNGYALSGIEAEAQGSDITGEAGITFAAQSRIEARLASRRVDVDALLASLPAAPQAAPQAPAPAPARPAAAPARSDGRIIPDTQLPLDALKLVDARLAYSAAELVFAATPYRDVALRLDLAGGRLDVPEFRATLPAGQASGALSLDAREASPPVALRLHAPALALAPLARAAGLPHPIEGRMALDLDMRGRGASPRAIAAVLDGHLGIAVDQAVIDNRLIDLVAGDLWRALVPGAPRGGSANVNCLAVRFDAAGGQAQARALLFDSNLAKVSGTGRVDLAQERLALRMQPTLRIAGGGISIPVDVGGSFAAPSYRPDPAGALGALSGIAGGAAAGAGQGAAVGGPLGAIVGGVLGAARPGAETAERDDCPAALALARGTAPPPRPDPHPAPAPAPQQQQQQQQQRSPIPGLPLPRLPFRL